MSADELTAIVPFYLPYPGGAERSMHEMLRRLAGGGWTVTALVPLAPFPNSPPEGEGVTGMDGVTVRRMQVADWFAEVERTAGGSAAILFSLAHLFRAQFDARVDRLLRPYRGKTAYFCRGDDPRDYYPSAIVVANSQAVLKTLPERRGVRNTVLTPLIAAPSPRPGVVRKYVTMINPSVYKGGQVFLEVARRMPQVQFLAQLGRSAPVEGLRSAPNITVREPAPDLDDLYAETKVLMTPSPNEPFGRVAVEGALGGCLLLLHDAAGLKETPVPRFCFVDTLDPAVWRQRLSQLLEASEAVRDSWTEEIRLAASRYDAGWEGFLADLKGMIAQQSPNAGPQEDSGHPLAESVDDFFTRYLPAHVEAQKRLLKDLKCSCRVVVSGARPSCWTLYFDGANSRVASGRGPANCEVNISGNDLSGIVQGTTTVDFLMNIPGRIIVRGAQQAAGVFLRLMY